MAVREPIERRSAVVFDARPPARGVAAAFRPRDLDQQWEDGADGIIPTANNEPPPLPEELPRHQVRDLANIAVYGLTWGEMMDMARGQTGEPEDNCPLANMWAAAFHKWATKHLE